MVSAVGRKRSGVQDAISRILSSTKHLMLSENKTYKLII